MSHFVGLLFGGDESVLDQYDENLEVKPYVRYTKEEAIEEAQVNQRLRYIHLSKRLGQNPKLDDWDLKTAKLGLEISDEQAWEIVKEWGYEIDEEDNLLSTYNPDSKWDWYQIGGRWSNYLPLKEPETLPLYEDCGAFDHTNVSTVEKVDWDSYFKEHSYPFCFITTTGEWHEKAGMGWWGMTVDDKEEDNWITEFKNYLNALDPDTQITAIDFHI